MFRMFSNLGSGLSSDEKLVIGLLNQLPTTTSLLTKAINEIKKRLQDKFYCDVVDLCYACMIDSKLYDLKLINEGTYPVLNIILNKMGYVQTNTETLKKVNTAVTSAITENNFSVILGLMRLSETNAYDFCIKKLVQSTLFGALMSFGIAFSIGHGNYLIDAADALSDLLSAMKNQIQKNLEDDSFELGRRRYI